MEQTSFAFPIGKGFYDNFVCLRLDVITETFFDEGGLLSTLVGKYVDKDIIYLIVREGGKNDDNPHIHATFRVRGKIQALRQWIKRSGFKGNQSYSLKVADPEKMDGHFRYLCKGDGTGKEDPPNVVFVQEALTDTVIEELHQAYWKENEELRNSRATKRKREEPAAKQILLICRQKIEHSAKLILTEDEVIDIVCAWYYEHKTSMNIFQMKAVVNYVIYGIDTDRKCDSNRTALLKASLKLNSN